MKGNWLIVIMIIATTVAMIWFGKVMFEAVVSSNLPGWLKYMILR